MAIWSGYMRACRSNRAGMDCSTSDLGKWAKRLRLVSTVCSREVDMIWESSGSGPAEGFLHGVDDPHAGEKGGYRGAAAEPQEVDYEREFRTAGQNVIIVPPGSQDGFEELVAKLHRPAVVERLHAFEDGAHQETAQRGRRLFKGNAGVTEGRRKHLAHAGALGCQQQSFSAGLELERLQRRIHQGDHPHLALASWFGLPELVFQQPPEVMGGIAGYDATGRRAGRAGDIHGKPHGAGQPQSDSAARWSVRAIPAQNDRGAVGHGAGLIEHYG